MGEGIQNRYCCRGPPSSLARSPPIHFQQILTSNCLALEVNFDGLEFVGNEYTHRPWFIHSNQSNRSTCASLLLLLFPPISLGTSSSRPPQHWWKQAGHQEERCHQQQPCGLYSVTTNVFRHLVCLSSASAFYDRGWTLFCNCTAGKRPREGHSVY